MLPFCLGRDHCFPVGIQKWSPMKNFLEKEGQACAFSQHFCELLLRQGVAPVEQAEVPPKAVPAL